MTYKTIVISGILFAVALGSIGIANAQNENSGNQGVRRFIPQFLKAKPDRPEMRPATSTKAFMATSSRPLASSTRPIKAPEKRDDRRASSTAPITINISCAKAAVDARQVALGAALTNFSNKAKALLDAREMAIKASFDKTNRGEAEMARKAAREAYKKGMREVLGPKSGLRSAEKTAYDAYNTAIKACGGVPEKASSATEGLLMSI